MIWYGTPHSPFKAAAEDLEPFKDLDEHSMHHYGELVAMDRSIGSLRSGLQKMGIEANTLVWFCSDNGGLPKIKPDTVGGLRGNKGTIYEGGLRVPAIIQWPAVITQSRITLYPASVLDIVPTVLDVVGAKYPDPKRPLDGVSLRPLFSEELAARDTPIPFRHTGKAALVDNRYKLLTTNIALGKFELYDLVDDPVESNNIAAAKPDVARRLTQQLLKWSNSVDQSFAGKDYPQGRVDASEPQPRFWTEVEAYQPYFAEWRNRWEYESRLTKRAEEIARSDWPRSGSHKGGGCEGWEWLCGFDRDSISAGEICSLGLPLAFAPIHRMLLVMPLHNRGVRTAIYWSRFRCDPVLICCCGRCTCPMTPKCCSRRSRSRA